jgi:hypothetical protein
MGIGRDGAAAAESKNNREGGGARAARGKMKRVGEN